MKRIDAVMEIFARIRRARAGAGCCWSATVRSSGTAYRLGRELDIASMVEHARRAGRCGAAAVGADLFLLPSAQESFGLAALEAMACEVPVVASHVGGLPEVIEHGVTGFLHARPISTAWRRAPSRCSPTRRCTAA